MCAMSLTATSVVMAASAGDQIRSGLTTSAQGAGYSLSSVSFESMVGSLISTALSYLGIVLLCYMLYAGFLWMTAGGESKKVDQAKTMIQNAVIGLLIIGIAYTASNFILNELNSAVTNSSPVGTDVAPGAATVSAASKGNGLTYCPQAPYPVGLPDGQTCDQYFAPVAP